MTSDGLGRYDTLFEDFLVNIALTQTQSKLIDDTLSGAISLFMSNYDDLDVYAQGSYATGTIVKPLTANQSKTGIAGEYDIDIVLERETWGGAVDALSSVKNILAEEYINKIDDKEHESCERVYHSKDTSTDVLFHADYVPIKSQLYGAFRYVAHRSDDNWAKSDTKRLKEWFLKYASDKPFIQAVIVILKRIRDYAGLTDKIPSICIMAITCDGYRQGQSYTEDLIMAIQKIVDIFSKPYHQIVIRIPTIDENLATKIKDTDCDTIKTVFQNCLSALKDEFIAKDVPDLDRVKEYLSDDFPGNLSNYPECLEPLRKRDWGIELDGSLKIKDIKEDNRNASSMKNKIYYRFIGKGKSLRFVASTDYEKSKYGIRWQVLNADGSDDRRGSLFEAKSNGGGKNSNEFINHETESYDGLHWIKYFIYEKKTHKVVEIGKKFHVEVEL
ncbi:hypothetical protein IJ098_03700 [Candidatus Saccharibacteria bacterium]|nr:hypothetical protein [Candidatus Saccharibacteria bacterium]